MSRGVGVPSVTGPHCSLGRRSWFLPPSFTSGKLRQKGGNRPEFLRLSLNQLLPSCFDMRAGEKLQKQGLWITPCSSSGVSVGILNPLCRHLLNTGTSTALRGGSCKGKPPLNSLWQNIEPLVISLPAKTDDLQNLEA